MVDTVRVLENAAINSAIASSDAGRGGVSEDHEQYIRISDFSAFLVAGELEASSSSSSSGDTRETKAFPVMILGMENSFRAQELARPFKILFDGYM